MLMTICSACGRKLAQGVTCPCVSLRQRQYNNEKRDQKKNKFYHSLAWRKIVEKIKIIAHGADELVMAESKQYQAGNIVHHIYTLEEKPDKALDINNLIFLSRKNHKKVHDIYKKEGNEKKLLQAKLIDIVTARGRRKKF